MRVTIVDYNGRMYTKLFGSIVHSTIWREPDHVRLVWITMLALSDKNGFVWASVPGLADASRVSVEQCREAVARLSSPDPDSRTQVAEGRRIEQIDGGWWLINHAKFQAIKNMDERRDAVRLAVQRHRAKKADGVINVIKGNRRKSPVIPVSPSDQTIPDQTKSKGFTAAPPEKPAVLFGQIIALIEEIQQPGQSAKRFIKKDRVAELGLKALAAYESCGGSERFVNTDGASLGYLRREFISFMESP